MHTEHWGPVGGTGPRALLLHGITSSAATMWELGTELADAGWSATAVDLPGHGQSGPAPSYAFADVADTIHAELGGGYDLLVGHSLGGAVGTVLLARHPDVARQAVLIDPALLIDDALLAGIAPELDEDKRLDAKQVAAANPLWHPRTVQARVEATAAADATAVRAWVTDNQPWDVRAAISAVDLPVLVLVAGHDAVVTPALIDQARWLNPRWSFRTVPESSHSVHRDQPAVVLGVLLQR